MGAVGEDLGQVRVVGAGDDPGPHRQPLQIRRKHFLYVGQVPVVVQMLPVQVGDDGDFGGQDGEGAVGLVGLGHENLAPAQDGVGPHPVPHRAHHHRGVEISGPEHRRGHGGGGGLAVHAGDRHLGLALHAPGQHLPPAQHGKPPGPGRGKLGVVLFDRSGMDHDGRVRHVFGPVALINAHPQPRQPPGDVPLGQIRAAHPVALAHQQLRQAAHADAADADEVVGCVIVQFHYFMLNHFCPAKPELRLTV